MLFFTKISYFNVLGTQNTVRKMLCLKFLLTSYVNIIIIHAGFIQDKLFEGIEMHFDRLDTQCAGKNAPFQSSLKGIKLTSTKIFIKNSTVIVKEDGIKNLLLTVIIDKCFSKENLDSCERVIEQGNIDFCTAINPNNPVINKSPFYVPFVPPLKCPIDKGIYRAHNFTIDIAPLLVFSKLDGWYWRIKNKVVSEQNKLVFCVFLDAYMTYSKSKKN